jgi:hypothetical protein
MLGHGRICRVIQSPGVGGPGYPLKAGQFDPGSAVVPAGLRASAPVNSRQDASAPVNPSAVSLQSVPA